MFERLHFAQDLASGQWTMTDLCTRYGISRDTGYKWRARAGPRGARARGSESRAALLAPRDVSRTRSNHNAPPSATRARRSR